MRRGSLVASAAGSALLLGILIAACEPAAESAMEPADLVLTGGKVVTVDDALPEAEALAVTGYTITTVGTNDEIAEYVGPSTRVIELDGRLVLPGFIEGHGHYMGLGRAKMILDLTTAASWDDIVQMVGDAAAQAEPGRVGDGARLAPGEVDLDARAQRGRRAAPHSPLGCEPR